MDKRMFECIDEKHNKFWEVWTEDDKLYTRYGKIETVGQLTCIGFNDGEEAVKGAEKLVAQKLKKGYVEVDE